jgi:hypothetical protein
MRTPLTMLRLAVSVCVLVAGVAAGARAQDDAANDPAAYLQKIQVQKLKVAPGTTGMGVFGEVKNLGSHTLNKVEITIYCLDASGKSVFEKTYNPVLVTGMKFLPDEGPLKPNYTRKFGVRLDDAPSEWAKKVDVKVTSVEFADVQATPKPSATVAAEVAEAKRKAEGAVASCAGCGVVMIAVPVIAVIISIVLLIWVARDAKARGMDSSILWMALVFFTNLLGLIIYLFARPKGDLVKCSHCGNKRLRVSAKCPHCGNA